MPFINLIISREPNEALSLALGQGITEITRRVLRKAPDVTSVAVSAVAPGNWIVGGRSLKDQGLASFWLDIKVTAGTNTKDEKAAYLVEVFAFMREHLGPLHEESYVLVHEVQDDAYGYGGQTQGFRYIRQKLSAAR